MGKLSCENLRSDIFVTASTNYSGIFFTFTVCYGWSLGFRMEIGGDEIIQSLQANLKRFSFLFIDVELVVIVVIDDPTSGRICLFLNYVELVNYCYCYCCD